MSKTNLTQLELFSETGEPATPAKRHEHNFVLLALKNHEKTILIIIAFLTTATLAYCVGIERGKKTARIYQTSFIDVAARPQDAEPVAQKTQPLLVKEPLETRTASLDTYTIQVATFQTKKLAQRAAEALKSNGHSPIILSSGKYSVVCVGNFPNKEKARSLLSELRKKFRDCYIRRL